MKMLDLITDDNIMEIEYFKSLFDRIYLDDNSWKITYDNKIVVLDDYWELGNEFVDYLNLIEHRADIKHLFINYFTNKTPNFEYMKYMKNEDLKILENSIYYDDGWKLYEINIPNRYYELGKEYIKNFNGNKEIVINHLHAFLSRELKYKIGYEGQYIDFIRESGNDIQIMSDKYYNKEIDFYEIIKFGWNLKDKDDNYIGNYFDFVKNLSIKHLLK